jgi:alkanesulfonate monooxygenase SsuD/methylene tetrahydromethanopterin reductase-like flavin-dependent oxidoreductase (luciferase family)
LRPPAEIAPAGFAADEQKVVDAMRRKAFVGTADQVASKLQALARELGLDELVINTWAHDPGARRRSYALLAEAFGLAKTPTNE